MACLRVPCLLLILLLILHPCLPQPGSQSPPSAPQCHIPYQQEDIHCFWEPGQDPQIATSYSLNWNSMEGRNGSAVGTNISGVIPRERYSSFSDLTVFVISENQYGSAKSKKAAFNTGDIKKPPSPEITHHCPQPLEIYWTLQCNDLGSSDQLCEVQYHTQDQQGWTQEEELLRSFLLLTPRPYTVYEFQVRCACEGPEALMSDWSSVYTAQSAESVPMEALDVWSDCGVNFELSQCALMWKEMPTCLTQGKVLGYVVTLSHSNGTVEVVNVSMSEPGGLCVCQEKRCCFTPSLQGVSGVHVSVYNSQGATKPAPLALPTSGLQVPELSFTVNLDILSLNVSWSLPSQPIENLQEYVVQYKQLGLPPTKGFDWIKVPKKNTSIFLRGDFKNYTTYNVSLFAVFINSSCLLTSAMVQYFHGLPPKVTEFKVQHISDSVTFSWQHISLTQRKELILRYQLVLNNCTEYNVSGDQSSFQLLGLKSGHHQVWIRAESKAGLGPSETISFSIENSHGYLIYLVTFLFIGVIFLLVIVIWRHMKTCEKVPDPSNSKLFQQMKLQFNSTLNAICSPLESNPKICELEVVENPFWDGKASPRSSPDGQTEGMVGEERTHTRTDQQGDKGEDADEGYSKIIDTDEEERDVGESGSLSKDDQFVSDEEERDVGESGSLSKDDQFVSDEEERDVGESGSLSEDDQLVSDYEKHFMPMAV